MTRDTSASRYRCRPAKRLTIFLELRDRAHHRSVMIELLKRSRRAKLAGLTVFGASVGYGLSGHLHQTQLLMENAPRSLVIVDGPERIDAFLVEIEDLIGDVLVVVDDVDVVEV